jgi:acetyl esterase/lipase
MAAALRLHAREWGIDPARVGVLGFSAGGDLAAVLSNRGARRDYVAVDAADTLGARPDFAVLVYPAYLVRSREDSRLRPEVEPSAATPPTFLAQAMDDPVGVENTAVYALALHHAGVPAELHLYATGGHGYGSRAAAGEVAAAWPDLALGWMKKLGVLDRR